MSMSCVEVSRVTDSCPPIGWLTLVNENFEQPLVLVFYPLEISIRNSNGVRITTFHSSNRIAAFAKIKPAGQESDWLLVLTELNDFYILGLRTSIESEFVDVIVIKQFMFTDVMLGNRPKLDLDNERKIVVSQRCFVKVDPSGRFIIIHSTLGFLIVLELKPSKRNLFSSAISNKQDKQTITNKRLLELDRYKVVTDPVVFWIGNEKLVDLQITQHINDSLWFVSTLTQSLQMDYTKRDFLLTKVKKLCLEKSSSQTVDVKPNLVVSNSYFHIYVFNDAHVIYPNPGFEIKCHLSNENATIIENRIILNLNPNEGLGEVFQHIILIDDHSYLIFTVDGQFYYLHVDYEIQCPDQEHAGVNKRTRRSFEEDRVNMAQEVIIKEWKLRKLNNVDFMFHFHIDKIDNQYTTINKHSRQVTFKLDNFDIIDVNVAESTISLPISSISFDCDELCYTCGDSGLSLIKSSNHEIMKQNERIKYHVTLGEFMITLNEVYQPEHSQRIDVYSKNKSLLSSYEIERDASVLEIFPFHDIKPYLPGENDFLPSEVQSVEKLLESSFIVLTSTSNIDEYDTEEEYYMRNRTEFLLFTIQSQKHLELKTLSVLKSKIHSITKLDERSFLCWNAQKCFTMGLELYRDPVETSNHLQIKFIKIDEQMMTGDLETISISKRLNSSFVLLVDPYKGIYVSRINQSNKVSKRPRLMFNWNLISTLDVFSEDTIIVGDILGNVIIFSVDYKLGKVPAVQVFSRFNLNSGGIGVIKCREQKMTNSETIEFAFVGTSDGAIFQLNIHRDWRKSAKSLNSFMKAEVEKWQNNFEMVADSNDGLLRSINLVDRPLLDDYFRVTTTTKSLFLRTLPISIFDIAVEKENIVIM